MKSNFNELTALGLVKHGFPVDDLLRQRLVEAGLIVHETRGWVLTETGVLWEEKG